MALGISELKIASPQAVFFMVLTAHIYLHECNNRANMPRLVRSYILLHLCEL